MNQTPILGQGPAHSIVTRLPQQSENEKYDKLIWV